MILWWWTFRRLSAWVVGSVFLACALLLAVDGVEQAGADGVSWWVSLSSRIPLMLRDLLGMTLVLAAGSMVLRARRRTLLGFAAAGVSPSRVAASLVSMLLIWSLLLGSALDWWIHQSPESPVNGWVHNGEVSLFVSSQDGEPLQAWSLSQQSGEWRQALESLSVSELEGLWSSRNPAESSLVQLGELESSVSQAWWQWRVLSLVFPALLAGFAVWLVLQTKLGVGWSLGLSLGLTLCTQVLGSMGAQAGLAPWLPLGALGAAAVGLLLWLQHAQSANRT